MKEKTQRTWKNTQSILSQEWIGVITIQGTCTGMEEGNVTNILRELFPDTKGRCKTDCEVSPTTFLCYKWWLNRDEFLSQLSIYDEAFC